MKLPVNLVIFILGILCWSIIISGSILINYLLK